MLKIYHNPRCRKSRAGLALAEQKDAQLDVIDYIKNGLSTDALYEIIETTGLRPFDLIRQQEDVFKKELKGKQLSDQEWIAAIVANPKLLKRPIIINNNKGVWADPPENLNAIL